MKLYVMGLIVTEAQSWTIYDLYTSFKFGAIRECEVSEPLSGLYDSAAYVVHIV